MVRPKHGPSVGFGSKNEHHQGGARGGPWRPMTPAVVTGVAAMLATAASDSKPGDKRKSGASSSETRIAWGAG